MSLYFVLLEVGNENLLVMLIIASCHPFVGRKRRHDHTGPILEWRRLLHYWDASDRKHAAATERHNVETAKFIALKLVVEIFLILCHKSVTIVKSL